MQDALKSLAGRHSFYVARDKKYDTGNLLPFKISYEPLELSKSDKATVLRLGTAIVRYMNACDKLYRSDSTLQALIPFYPVGNGGTAPPAKYLFYRPDLILTNEGMSICEIETSPFGLGLSELLNRGYRSQGFDTMVDASVLKEYISASTPRNGLIVYSDKTMAYKGQLEYIANNVFSGGDRIWQAAHVSNITNASVVYRAHYLHEMLYDQSVASLYESVSNMDIYPSLTRHMEEKALMALIWDSRYSSFIKEELNYEDYILLREVMPHTWIVGQEEFALPSTEGRSAQTLDQLAETNRSNRKYVLKVSGFSKDSSWAEGVYFLHKLSKDKLQTLINMVNANSDCLYVVQEFKDTKKVELTYHGDNSEPATMNGRVRITPYYAASDGKMLSIKATICEGTERIHASSSSVNTAVL